MIELMFLKELMLIRQANQKIVMFITIGIFLNKGVKFQSYVCNRCHNLLMILLTLKVVSATFLLVCFVRLKESTCETRKKFLYLTLKALFILEIIKF